MRFEPVNIVIKALLVAILCTSAFASVANVYLAQSAVGSGDGSSCANAKAITFFNTSGNWGAGSTQIGAGTTVHLCGTLTTAIAAQGSGSSGNPITILFESGAKFSKANWGTVNVFDISGDDWITVDGGGTGCAAYVTGVTTSTCNTPFVSNGIIENTNVGSTSNPTVDTSAIFCGGSSNVIVKNMTVQNLYVKTVNDDLGGGDAIHCWGNNDRITNNLVHDTLLGPTIDYLGTQTGGEIDHNMIYHANQAMVSADRSSTSTSNGMLINDNSCHDWANWDNPAQNAFHHNCMIIEVNNDTASISNMQIYNNYGYGDTGVLMTGEVFLDAEGNGTNGSYNNVLIYNNLLTDTSTVNAPSNALIITKANGGSPAVKIYNNTFIYPSSNKGRCIMNQGAAQTTENNVANECALFIFQSAGTNPLSDYNDLFQNGGSDISEGTHSTTGNPNLNISTFLPQLPSAAVGAALNLTSLGVTPLDSDKAGVARPASGAWDVGAYTFSGAITPPPAPTALPFI